jgi:hypothetical protein
VINGDFNVDANAGDLKDKTTTPTHFYTKTDPEYQQIIDSYKNTVKTLTGNGEDFLLDTTVETMGTHPATFGVSHLDKEGKQVATDLGFKKYTPTSYGNEAFDYMFVYQPEGDNWE